MTAERDQLPATDAQVLRGTVSSAACRLTGRLDDECWAAANWSGRFVDMVSGLPGVYDTRAAVVAHPEGLLVGFAVEEPYPRATLTERDSLVFQENDIELFLDFGWGYYELEVNVLGTVYEVMHIWRESLANSPFAGDPTVRLDNPSVFTFGGDYDRRPASFWRGTHPRGERIALLEYDFPGLSVAVSVQGSINEWSTPSTGWSAEIQLPWPELARLSGGTLTPSTPSPLRAFLGRFQQLPVGGEFVTAAWCHHAHGVADTHQPERFTTVVFDG
jgi:hypothetical protein